MLSLNSNLKWLLLLTFVGVITGSAAQAQPIAPAADGTGTQVTPQGNQFDITGGQRSRDGANLFHSFERFGLSEGQVANFWVDPALRNVLGRVVGGEASVIDGLLQVSGGSANLFLLNPSGILFGPHASLNLPASFTATTATGIGLEANWFSAIGSNDYAALVGTPDRFAFTTSQPGAVVNAGSLAVGEGQSLTVMGGTVINTGQLTAPGGQVTMLAVPGETVVRLSQPGSPLSIEIQPLAAGSSSATENLPVASLAELLTGGDAGSATGVTVSADGTVQLTGAGMAIPSEAGTAIASGQIDVSATESGQTGGTVNLLGDRVAVVGGTIDASGTSGGGTIRIGGDVQGQGAIPNADRTFISEDSAIRSDAIQLGDGGRVIVFAEETARVFGEISARGGAEGGNGGFVETSGLQTFEIATTPDVSAPAGVGGEWLIDPNDIEIVAGNGNTNINANNPFVSTNDSAQLGVDLVRAALTGGANVTITTGTGGSNAQAGDITLSTPLDFEGTGGNTLTLSAANSIFILGQIFDSAIGGDLLNLVLNADIDGDGVGAAVVAEPISTQGGSITLSGAQNIIGVAGTLNSGGGNITLTGTSLTNEGINVAAPINSGTGNITLTANQINLAPESLGSPSLAGTGNLLIQPLTANTIVSLGGFFSPDFTFLNAAELNNLVNGFNSITIGRADGSGAMLLSGDVTFNDPVTLRSPSGNGFISTTAGTITGADNATITLQAAQAINTGSISNPGRSIMLDGASVTTNGLIDTRLASGSGAIALTARSGAITVNNDLLSDTQGGGPGGAVTLNAAGDIIVRGLIHTFSFITGGNATNGANITITSANGNVQLLGGQLDASSAVEFGNSANAGSITIEAPNGNITSNSALRAESRASGTAGRGGDIRLNSGRNINLTNNISTFAVGNGTGAAGSIFLSANNAIDARSNGALTFDASSTGGVGTGGQLGLAAPDVTLTGNEIELLVSSIVGGGNLVLQPLTANQAIALGGTEATPALDLTATELGAFLPGFQSITIGRINSAGAITLAGDVTFLDPVTVRSPLGPGSIQGDGNITLGERATLNLFANQSIRTGSIIESNFGGVASPGSRAISATSTNGAIEIFSVFNRGDLTLNALGDIRVGDVDEAGAINLSSRQGSITTGDLRPRRGNDIALRAAGDITLPVGQGISVVEGNVSLRSGGTISIDTGISSGGGDITLTAADDVTPGPISTEADGPFDSGNLSIVSGGSIDTTLGSQCGLFSSCGISTFSEATSGTVSLAAADSIITSGIDTRGSLSAGNILATAGDTIDASRVLFNGATNEGGLLDASSSAGTGGDILLTAGTRIAAGDLTATAPNGGGDINLVANEVDFTGGADGIASVSSNGNLVIQPATPDQDIAIAGTEAGPNTLDLTATEVAALQEGFSSITIGRSDSTGNITVSPTTLSDPTVLQTGSGFINLQGGFTLLDDATVSLISNQPTILSADLVNSGNPIIFGDVLLANDVTVSVADQGNITFAGTIDGNHALTLNAGAGTVSLGDAVGSQAALTGLTVNAQNTAIFGDITAQGDLRFNSAVDFLGGSVIQAGSGAIAFSSNLTLADLSLTLMANEIDFTGGANSVTGSGRLVLQPGTAAQNIEIGGASETAALDLTASDVAALQNGFSEIAIGRADGEGNIRLQPVALFDPTTLQTDSGFITLENGFTLLDNASLTLLSAQPTILRGNLAIPGDRFRFGSVLLEGDVTVSNSANQGDLIFGGTVDGEQLLTVNAGAGRVRFNGPVGRNAALAGLEVNAGVTDIAGTVTTQGNIRLNSALNITNAAQLNATEGAIAVTGAIQGVNRSPVSLAANDDISVNNVTAEAGISLRSRAGAVTSGNLNSASTTADGGPISAIARTSITTGSINSSSTSGNGGNVLLDPEGDIQVESINTQGGPAGTGGTVDITTARFFRATRTFSDQNGTNASISTAGGAGGGATTIRHGGGSNTNRTPFIVGNAATNGTAGAITTGLNTINPTQGFILPYEQGNIRILTPTVAPPERPEDLTLPPDPEVPSVTLEIVEGDVVLTEVVLPEQSFTGEFAKYLGEDFAGTETPESIRETLQTIAQQTGKKSALIYVTAGDKELLLSLFMPNSPPISRSVPTDSREDVLAIAKQFVKEVSDPRKTQTTSYLASAQQLYRWLIAPIEADLQAEGIDTLVFSMDAGLRSLPLAALHDGQQFLIEKYSIGLVPSLSLTDTRYRSIKDGSVLAMGASTFAEQGPLPAVPVELALITQQLWPGKAFLNQDFTLENLKSQRQQQPFEIIHLATHGEFKPGALSNSYIQLSDTKLRLDQLRQLQWNNPPVDLLVLSACRTALGDQNAELGFAGLAVQSGVKTAIASLWYVSDEGTLGLMSEFYRQLRLPEVTIKAEALRQAQIAMLQGQIVIEDGQLRGAGFRGGIDLPPELAEIGVANLAHPYYWSAFTMIGSPW